MRGAVSRAIIVATPRRSDISCAGVRSVIDLRTVWAEAGATEATKAMLTMRLTTAASLMADRHGMYRMANPFSSPNNEKSPRIRKG